MKTITTTDIKKVREGDTAFVIIRAGLDLELEHTVTGPVEQTSYDYPGYLRILGHRLDSAHVEFLYATRQEMLSMQGRKVRVEFPNGDRTFGLSAIEGKYSEKPGGRELVGDFSPEDETNYEIIDLPIEEPKNPLAIVRDGDGSHWVKEADGWRMQDQESHCGWSVVEDYSPLTVVFEGVEAK